MFRMSTLIQKSLVSLMRREDRHQHLTLVVLAEMPTRPALSIMNSLHNEPPVL